MYTRFTPTTLVIVSINLVLVGGSVLGFILTVVGLVLGSVSHRWKLFKYSGITTVACFLLYVLKTVIEAELMFK